MKEHKLLDKMTKNERSLLLYFETRAVDYGGRIDTKMMKKTESLQKKYCLHCLKAFEGPFMRWGSDSTLLNCDSERIPCPPQRDCREHQLKRGF